MGDLLMKLLIIDGNSIMNRSFYGVRPLTTKSGINTNAIFGFLNIMMKTIKEIEPDGVLLICLFPPFDTRCMTDTKALASPPPTS